MSFTRIASALVALCFALVAGSGCAASLCERKHRFMTSTCSGGDVVYHPDSQCEEKVKRCSPGQLAAFEGYVGCLESQNLCSMEALARCAEAYPGGVNLTCG